MYMYVVDGGVRGTVSKKLMFSEKKPDNHKTEKLFFLLLVPWWWCCIHASQHGDRAGSRRDWGAKWSEAWGDNMFMQTGKQGREHEARAQLPCFILSGVHALIAGRRCLLFTEDTYRRPSTTPCFRSISQNRDRQSTERRRLCEAHR